MEEKQDKIKKENINNNIFKINKNIENSCEKGLFFYVMTLQTDSGEKYEIKIYENSNASELAFNFCKIYNLDFETMKYLKKCIKQIIQQFQDNNSKEIVYFLKDNNSIQEVAEEEILTENSLKKSGGTIKKNNNNNSNNNANNNAKIEEEKEEKTMHNNNQSEKKIKEENIKENINKSINLDLKEINGEIKENDSLKEINKKEKKIFESDEIIKINKSLEDEENIEHKDYSIDYFLDNDSIELFSPTDHTTKIEQRSSIRNNSSFLGKNSKNDRYIFDKKNISKNKKNNKNISCNKTYNRQNCSSNYNKIKKEEKITTKKSIKKEINLNSKKQMFIKKNLINNNIRKKPQSVKKISKKIKNRTPHLELSQNNKKPEGIKQNKSKYKNNKNKYEKFMTNMNDMKNKYLPNYFNIFLKSKNICNTLSRNSINSKYQTSRSINQESNKSKSISKNKINKNLTQKSLNKPKVNKNKEESMTELNSRNLRNLNNPSKININTILKKDYNLKEKNRIIIKNKMKTSYNFAYNNNTLFGKNGSISKRNSSSKRKKESQGKDLFLELKNKKFNSNGITKGFTASLINIHKLKDSQDYQKQSLGTDRMIIRKSNKNIKSREFFNKLFRNDSNLEKNNIKPDKLYSELINKQISNNLNQKNKRNNTEINFTHGKIKNEYKGRLLTCHKQT